MPHKILIASFTFAPNKDGVAQASTSMAYGLADRGFDVVVVTGNLDCDAQVNPHPNVRVEHFDVGFDSPLDAKSRSETSRMMKFIVDEAPDAIICHCWETWSTNIAESIFNQLTAKRILVSHGYNNLRWTPNFRPPFGLGFWLKSLVKALRLPKLIRCYDRIVFLSFKKDWNRFIDYRVAKLLAYPGALVIPNGTEPDPKRGDPQEFRNAHGLLNRFAVLCVANYGPGKNQALAIRVFRKAQIQNSTLVLIGSQFNAYARECMSLDERLQKLYPDGRVVFIENIDREQTLAAYAACDVFLLTSSSECQPITLLEAMAAGKPFISTDTGCIREMPGGLVVDGAKKLAAALQLLEADPARRQALGTIGRKAVLEYFSREKVLDAHHQMLCALLK